MWMVVFVAISLLLKLSLTRGIFSFKETALCKNCVHINIITFDTELHTYSDQYNIIMEKLLKTKIKIC